MDTEWAEFAACRDEDPALFFPDTTKNDDIFPARRICNECPVRVECLQFAIDNKIEYGVWGGHGINARKRIKKKRREVA